MHLQMTVAQWLHGLGLGQYASTFRDNDIDDETLRHLTEADLDALGVKSVGHRRRLASAIAVLGDSPQGAERRQLTVLYCHTAGSGPEWSGQELADLEARRAFARTFHQTCAQAAEEYEGHLANFY